MQVPGLELSSIPNTRKVHSDTELHQFVVADKKNFEQAAEKWVRSVAPRALTMTLDAGNPHTYSIEIDGETSRGGAARPGAGFRPGTIAAAKKSVRVLFIGTPLAELCNRVKPYLIDVIKERTIAHTGRLEEGWSWWISEGDMKTATIRPLGAVVPPTVSIYATLWLVPESAAPASYAWFVNRNVHRDPKFQMFTRTNKRKKTVRTFIRKRPRGFLAEATTRARRALNKTDPILVQGWFIKRRLTGAATVATRGVPVVRVAFRKSLLRPVEV